MTKCRNSFRIFSENQLCDIGKIFVILSQIGFLVKFHTLQLFSYALRYDLKHSIYMTKRDANIVLFQIIAPLTAGGGGDAEGG